MRIRYLKKTEELLASSPWVVQAPEAWKGLWREQMSGEQSEYKTPAARQRLSLEIGCGKGKYICEMAKNHPDQLFIGDERVSTILARTVLKAEKESDDSHALGALSNLRLIRVTAEELEAVFAPGEVDRIFLTFSDPWPKEKHAKRRLTSDRFLPIYQRLLSPQGDLCFKTDNDALFAWSLESLLSVGWRILERTDDLHGALEKQDFGPVSSPEAPFAAANPGVLVTTEYEENFIRIGKNIHYLRAVPPV